MILGPDRAKLSKRHGATTITEYQRQGYLAEAMVNFLALLGWSFDDKTELLSREELINGFSLERVGKTAAIFNKSKLEWMNGVYLRKLNAGEFVRQAMPFLDRDLPGSIERPLNYDYASRVLSLVQERAKTLADVPELAGFFLVDELRYDTGLLLSKELDARSAIQIITTTLQKLEKTATWDASELEEILRQLAAELSVGTGKLFGLLRVAVTGRVAAPPLFQTMAVLGKAKCLERLNRAKQRLSTWSN
jgi:glutamyl-tRNA synthetase